MRHNLRINKFMVHKLHNSKVFKVVTVNPRIYKVLVIIIAQFWSLSAVFGGYEDLSPVDKALKDYDVAQTYTEFRQEVSVGQVPDLNAYGTGVVVVNDMLNLASLSFLDEYTKAIVASAGTKPKYQNQYVSYGNLGRIRALVNNEASHDLAEIDWDLVYEMTDKALVDCGTLETLNFHCDPEFLIDFAKDLEAFSHSQDKFSKFQEMASFAAILSI